MPARSCTEERFFGVQFRVAEVEARTFTGVAAPFDTWTPIAGNYLERFTADTFRDSVERGRGRTAPLLENHDRRKLPIGKVVEWQTTDTGLVGTWQVDVESERGAEVFRMVRDGYVRGLSVSFDRTDDDIVDLDGDVPRVTRVGNPLHEVSLVSVPAYADAQITLVRSAGLQRADPRIAEYRRKMNL